MPIIQSVLQHLDRLKSAIIDRNQDSCESWVGQSVCSMNKNKDHSKTLSPSGQSKNFQLMILNLLYSLPSLSLISLFTLHLHPGLFFHFDLPISFRSIDIDYFTSSNWFSGGTQTLSGARSWRLDRDFKKLETCGGRGSSDGRASLQRSSVGPALLKRVRVPNKE